MRKLVVLKLDGDLEQGVRVTLEIGEEDSRPLTEITAQLPPYPDLVTAIDQWQSTYRSLGQSSRLEAKKIVYGGSIAQWRSDCAQSVGDLRSHLHNWLLSESFRPIREKWLQQLSPSDEVRVLIRSSSLALRKLPWHLWDLVEDYPKAEVAYCVPESEQSASSKTPTYRDKVRILAILGNSKGINVQKDRQLLENLPDAATTFLVEPQRQDINDQLWNQPWDILFFAGHSQSEGDTGRIFINQTDSLTIAQLKYALRNAVAGGLQLAIFNSCDGLGLAIELQELHVGQMIVMRDPVPDLVAQEFLTDFLAAFATGKSFYLAEREAREKLHGLEDNFPCASWLPVIFQNPAAVPPMWQDLGRRPTDVCPYRGLFAFREEDAPFFYGRDAFTQMLVEAVQQQSLVAVIGPSGSGKSSVVFAGLIPQLRVGAQGFAPLHIVSFRPGDRPFRNLAAKLVPLLETQMSETDQLLEINKQTKALGQGDLALRDVVTRILEKNFGDRFLLVVDQFEELYTLCRDARERLLFLDNLLEAVERTPNFTLVLTLRADFLGQALSYRPFGDALQYADLKLSPMNREELQAAVEQPAKMLGVTIDSGLTERIIEAVSAEPGDLPLLEFALNQLWAKQRNAQLTHAAYEEIGGVEAALSRYAEEAYGRLNEEEKERARRIFIQLVRPGEGTEDTRRLATRTEVGEENWDLVTRLADARLVVSSRDEALGEETVEIVHEALIGGWERLNLWIELDRSFRTWQERLRASLRQWEASGKDEGALLRGVSLAEAEGWLQSRAVELSLSERSFIERSAKARTRQRRRLVFGLSVGLLGALTLAGITGLQWQRAEKQRQIAVVGQLAAQANWAREQFKLQPTEALLSAMRSAYELKRLSQGEAEWLRRETKGEIFRPVVVLQSFLDNIREQKFTRRSGQSTEVQFSPKGDRVIASESTTESHTDTVWDLQGNQLATLKGYQQRVETVQLSPDGKYILTTGGGYTAELWNLQGKQLAVLKGYDDRVDRAEFSSDGKHIVTIHSNRTRLWNLQGNLIAVFEEQHLREFSSFQYSPDGQHIVTLHGNGSARLARLWDLQGNLIAVFKEGRFGILAAQFKPDGQQLITISEDGSTKLWDIHGKQLAILAGEQDRGVARFSPDGKRFVKVGNGIVRLFDLQGKQLAAFKSHQELVIAVQFSPDGKSIVTGGSDGTARLWNLQGKQLAVFKGYRGIPISEFGYLRLTDPVQFSPDGKRLATTEGDQRGRSIIRLWDFRGNPLGVFHMYTPSSLQAVQFSPDGKRLAAHANEVTYLLHLQDNQLATFAGQQGKVKTVQLSADGKHVTTLGEDGTVRLWNSQGDRLETFKARQGDTKHVQFSPRGDRILTTTWGFRQENNVQIRNLQGNQLAVLNGSWGNNWQNPIISPDGKYVVTRGKANTIQIWDMEGNQVGISPAIPGILRDLRFSPKGDSIATAEGGGMIRLWDLRGKELAAFKAASERVSTVYLNSDGKRITDAKELAAINAASEIIKAFYFTSDGKRIITNADNGFRVWDLKGNQLEAIEKVRLTPLTSESYDTRAISDTSVFHPETGRFMTQYGGDIAFQWDLKGKQLATLQGREGWFQWSVQFNLVGEQPSSVQLSSDGDRIATLGGDGMVRVWDSKGQLLAEYEGYAMALSRDGKRIVVVSKDNIPRMWRVDDLDGLLKRGCDWLRPYLALSKGDDSDRKMCGISGVK